MDLLVYSALCVAVCVVVGVFIFSGDSTLVGKTRRASIDFTRYATIEPRRDGYQYFVLHYCFISTT